MKMIKMMNFLRCQKRNPCIRNHTSKACIGYCDSNRFKCHLKENDDFTQLKLGGLSKVRPQGGYSGI